MSIELEGKCLCYHGPLLYEAKVLRVYDEKTRSITSKEYKELSIDDERAELDRPPEDMAEGPCYFVHYQGWKASWDEWVGLDRIRPYNEENLELKQSLVEQARAAKAAASASANSATPGKRGRKKAGARPVGRPSKKDKERERLASKGSEDSAPSSTARNSPDAGAIGVKSERKKATPVLNKRTHPKIYIKVPISLRSVLVDDWEHVTKDRQLVELPSKRPIDQILSQFYTDTSNSLSSPVEQAQLSEFIHGIKLYFNFSLGKLLLYRLERIQYADLLKEHPEKMLTRIYGMIHLLRLITLLPEMIESSNVDDQMTKILVKHSDLLLEWIAINITQTFLLDPYINTSSQYEGVALSL